MERVSGIETKTKTAKILEHVGANPGASIASIAHAVYPELTEPEAMRKATTMVGVLSGKGRLKRLARGSYALADTKKRRALSSLKIEARVHSIRATDPVSKREGAVVFAVKGGGFFEVRWPAGSALPDVGDRWTFEARAKR